MNKTIDVANGNPLPISCIRQLKKKFPQDNLFTDPADCWTYGYDNSRIHSLPAAVVFANTHAQVVDLVELCKHYEIPLTTRGRGTGTTGATVPSQHGIVLSMERMCNVIDYSPENRYITVEPGIINQTVQDLIGQSGFFWPPDPTSAAFCTVGGNLAYNSAGPKAVKYGTPRENTLGLTAVTGGGKTIKTGVFTTKGVVGYDLTRLLIGSEGTLAIITQATLRITPKPEKKQTLRIAYSTISSAAHAISQIMNQPCIPCALEFMDSNAINIIARYSPLDLPKESAALLMVEIDGNKESIPAAIESIRNAANTKGLIEMRVAESDQEIQDLWKTRKALSPALRQTAPGKINEDIVVPVSRLAELIDQLNQLSKKFKLPIVNFGHAGNGNIHVNILYDPDSENEQKRAHQCLEQIFDCVLKLNGTLSGEHGIGLVKRDYIDREIDADTLQLMRSIKKQFDPKNILNPDKMFPTSLIDAN